MLLLLNSMIHNTAEATPLGVSLDQLLAAFSKPTVQSFNEFMPDEDVGHCGSQVTNIHGIYLSLGILTRNPSIPPSLYMTRYTPTVTITCKNVEK